MQRSIFQLIVLPYLASHPARTTWSAFSTSSRWAKTAANVEAGPSNARTYDAWTPESDVDLVDTSLELLRLPIHRPGSSRLPPYLSRPKPPRHRPSGLQPELDPGESSSADSVQDTTGLQLEQDEFAARLLHDLGLDPPIFVEQKPLPSHPTSSTSKSISNRVSVTPPADTQRASQFRNHDPPPDPAYRWSEQRQRAAIRPDDSPSISNITAPLSEATEVDGKLHRHPKSDLELPPEFRSLLPDSVDPAQAASVRTAIWAIYRIVNAYWTTCQHKESSSELTTDTAQSHATSTVLNRDRLNTSLPPLFTHLLSRRLYRLAAFHYINTPEYASDPILLEQLASRLEAGGSAKLAARLRRGFDVPRKTDGRGHLGSESIGRDSLLPLNAWEIPRLPPDGPDPTISNRQKRLTEFHNSHLEYLLYKPASPHFQNPLGTTPAAPGSRFSRPSPNLRQLRDLLIHVENLERTRGFIPDKRTAHLIIRCWLRCGSGWNHSSRQPSVRIHKTKDGRMIEAPKQHSEAIFDAKTVRLIWHLVSKIMVREVARLEAAHTTGKNKEMKGENRLRYQAHIKPFCQMMKKAMLEFGDKQGFKEVVKWKREMRGRMVQLGEVESENALELELGRKIKSVRKSPAEEEEEKVAGT
ncbi:hypothetical protein BCR39DRAFT_524453 [Naematelia encephala]|uniref:Uncharacterized protein n=1 Tax=Naematelia encephala TaxID=71784 RepID=A0A1Y2BBG4_9TREE|nr:hypothetical protein BCR39DRAFT_524453 [Naematelia encephala]